MLILFFFSKEIIVFLFGVNWIEAGEYLRALSGTFLFIPLFDLLKFYLISEGKIMLISKIKIFNLIGLFLSLILIFLFPLDLINIAWFYSFISFLSLIFVTVNVFQKLKISFKIIFLYPLIISLILTSILLYSDQLHWIILSFFYVLIYAILIMIIEKKILIEILNLFKK
jgi:O-antigen/teichoic acid export membrane protein